MSFVICLSGPERTRAKAEVALETARIPLLPSDHHATMDWATKIPAVPSGKKPKEPHGFITVEHTDVDEAVKAVAKAGWVLRVHHHTPEAPEPSDGERLVATISEMQARIQALEARVR